MMHPYLKPLVSIYQNHANPEHAIPMKKYMKNKFEYYGIKTPERRLLNKNFFNKFAKPEDKELIEITQQCWNFPQRELQYFAMELLGKFAKKVNEDRMELYEFMIINKSWWDTVDLISTKLVGVYFNQYPEKIIEFTGYWMNSGNIWLQRTSLLFQLLYKDNTDLDLLTKYILALQGSKEFFINKAIGWILRQYSKTDADWVIQFVNNYQLSPLSHREALKWLQNRK